VVLAPRKGLILGANTVPDQCLLPLAPGLRDGDGSIADFVQEVTRKTYPDYRYERLGVSFLSASRPHIDWLRERLRPISGTLGYVETSQREGRHDMYKLKYGKAATIRLLTAFYPNPDVPRLIRKWEI